MKAFYRLGLFKKDDNTSDYIAPDGGWLMKKVVEMAWKKTTLT